MSNRKTLFFRPSGLLRAVRPEWVALGLAIYCVGVLNGPFWRGLLNVYDVTGVREGAVLAVAGVMLVLVLWIVFNALAHRFIFKPMAAVLVLLAGISSSFGSTFGTLFDWTMVQNAMQTDAHEAADVLTWRMVLQVVVLTGPALAGLALVRIAYRPLLSEIGAKTLQLGAASVAVAGLAVSIGGSLLSITRAHQDLRHRFGPLNIVASAVDYVRRTAEPGPLQPIAVVAGDAIPRADAGSTRPRVLILVVGETARAQSFGVLGYGRPTTPELSAIPDLVAFTNASSCGTSTAHSLPCMFSNLGRAQYSAALASRRENLLDVLVRAKVDAIWRDNQAGSKGLSKRVVYQQVNIASAKGYGESDTLDMALLNGLEDTLGRVTRDTVVVLHMMGSHGPAYYKRYDASRAPFSPTCQSTTFSTCTAQQLINTYDNSIHYTDHVLGSLHRMLQTLDTRGLATAFVYMSDHGESLGENGIYLHGMPYALAPKQQTHIPFLAWLSPKFKSDNGVDTACMAQQRTKPTSHDDLFHTALGLLDVSTTAYTRDRDVFAACRHGH